MAKVHQGDSALKNALDRYLNYEKIPSAAAKVLLNILSWLFLFFIASNRPQVLALALTECQIPAIKKHLFLILLIHGNR